MQLRDLSIDLRFSIPVSRKSNKCLVVVFLISLSLISIFKSMPQKKIIIIKESYDNKLKKLFKKNLRILKLQDCIKIFPRN